MPMFDYNLNPLPVPKSRVSLPITVVLSVPAAITASDLPLAMAAPTKDEFDAVVELVNALKAQANSITTVLDALKVYLTNVHAYLAELEADLGLMEIREA